MIQRLGLAKQTPVSLATTFLALLASLVVLFLQVTDIWQPDATAVTILVAFPTLAAVALISARNWILAFVWTLTIGVVLVHLGIVNHTIPYQIFDPILRPLDPILWQWVLEIRRWFGR